MSNYKNGFYIYTPTKDGAENMCELSMPQIIEIYDGAVWLTGCSDYYDIDYVAALGTIGKMVMSQEGGCIMSEPTEEQKQTEADMKLALKQRAMKDKCNEGKS